MMKKLLAVVVAAVIVMSFSTQAHSIEAFLSYWNGKDTDNGYGLGIGHQIKIIPILFADVRASWLSFGDTDVSVFPLEGLFGAKLGMFYGGVGPGYYIFDGLDNAWGGFGVGGLKFTIAKIGAFAELKYTWVETKNNLGDVDASGVGLNVGVIFGWI